uniref:Putative serine/threonine protein kinase n=1 Tax=Trypanosoma congolense (strain IL3000) TaxID=1068625 RepID=G0UYG9_TRYCI|nr:putative serine/threonine protein kinase [Trypanosoma congolense IL3000]
MEDLHSSPPRHRSPDESGADGQPDEGDDYDDEYYDNSSTLNSSTSTAGPPGPARTGRYNRINVDLSMTNSRSPTNSPPRRYRRSSTAKRTGSYRVDLSEKRHVHSKGRSLSNASTVASLLGSVPEWTHSFCVFSPGRVAAPPRKPFVFGQKTLFGGNQLSLSSGRPLSIVDASPDPRASSPRLGSHHPPFSFSPSRCVGVNGMPLTTESCRNSTNHHQIAGQISSPSASPSPLPGAQRCGLHSALVSCGTSPRSAGRCAMGGPPWSASKCGVSPGSTSQKELPDLIRSLASYLALTGTQIISGNTSHSVDIHKGPLIGVGGFAKVYAGVDCVTGDLVAIKEVNMAEVNDQERFRTISKEFGVLKSLRHPNIVSYRFFEHSVSQKVCRIVMELHTGGSTLSLLSRFGPLCEAILRRFSRNLLEAIAFIHQKGFLHRDIKPANILVSHDGVIKLCDFGCCKRINELNKSTNCVIGTPLYMAPEFIKGELTHKSDIWSMGCSLFELATGKLPWYHTGLRDHLPLMFYITTTSESPLVIPPQDEGFAFSPEFINFMEQCFIRDVSKRAEAVELLNHPWITGRKNSLFDIPGGNPRTAHTHCCSPPHNLVEEEQLCQYGLEDVAALISIEMCNMWMSSSARVASTSSLRASQHTELQNRSDDNMMAYGVERRATEFQAALTNSRSESPAASCFSGFGGASTCPTLCLDTALQDNFNYTVPQGSSAGQFIFPQNISFSTLLTSPQYLRITEDGNLEFATAADEDQVEIGAYLDESLTTNTACPRMASTYGGHSVTLVVNSPHIPPPTSTSNYENISVSLASTARSSTYRNSRFAPLVRNHSMSLLSTSSLGSRVVSPSRYPQQGINISPVASQSLQPLGVVTPLSPKPAAPSVAPSSEDLTREGPHQPTSPPTTSRLLDNIKRDKSGRLCMTFSVPTGGFGQRVNIPLLVNPEDVQYKVIERSPSFVVIFSDDVKSQITAKMNEISSSVAVTFSNCQNEDATKSSHHQGMFFSIDSKRSSAPNGSTSRTILNSPNSLSFGPQSRKSPPPQTGGRATGGDTQRTSRTRNGSSSSVSCASPTHSSSNGRQTPPHV